MGILLAQPLQEDLLVPVEIHSVSLALAPLLGKVLVVFVETHGIDLAQASREDLLVLAEVHSEPLAANPDLLRLDQRVEHQVVELELLPRLHLHSLQLYAPH